MKDTMISNNTNSMAGTTRIDGNGGSNSNYSATRTSATSDITFLGISNTVWTWLVIGITAIAIISLIVFYMRQNKSTNNLYNSHRDN